MVFGGYMGKILVVYAYMDDNVCIVVAYGRKVLSP